MQILKSNWQKGTIQVNEPCERHTKTIIKVSFRFYKYFGNVVYSYYYGMVIGFGRYKSKWPFVKIYCDLGLLLGLIAVVKLLGEKSWAVISLNNPLKVSKMKVSYRTNTFLNTLNESWW